MPVYIIMKHEITFHSVKYCRLPKYYMIANLFITTSDRNATRVKEEIFILNV